MKKDSMIVILSVILCCTVMAFVDGIVEPPYAVKSAIKVLLFLVAPLGFCVWRKLSPTSLFRLDKKAIFLGLGLGVAVIVVILAGYCVLAPWLDLSSLPQTLTEDAGITADNFVFVAVYIAFCNSLLEEFFFRGFAFLELKKNASTAFAYIFSAAAFALYHAAFLDMFGSWILSVLTVAALFVCGLLFNFLDARQGRIWVSWLVHMCANIAINTIGMSLLGIL